MFLCFCYIVSSNDLKGGYHHLIPSVFCQSVNFSHFHLLLWNHLMDWYYLIHKYNTKSSRAKLGDAGKKSTIDLELYIFKWINYLQKCFITEVNISLSLQVCYHKLCMAGFTEMGSIYMISSSFLIQYP